MSFEEFQNGQHGSQLGNQNGMVLAILNLHVTPMSPIVWAHSDLGFESRCGFKIFKMVAQAAILDIGTERF